MSYRSLLVLFVLCFSFATISAQTVTGSITGSLTDPHGAVVPDAKVTLTSESTGAVRQINSDQRGDFTFNALQPDSYTLTVEHSGFKKYEKKNWVLNPSDHLSAGQALLRRHGCANRQHRALGRHH